MSSKNVRGYVLTGLGVIGLSISAISQAAEQETWSVVDEAMNESAEQVDGLKGKLTELRDEKTHLFNETFAFSNEDRAVAKEPKPQNNAQEAQLAEVNTAIHATESKIDRGVKKQDYLKIVKTQLRDEDSLEKSLGEVDHSISNLQHDLRPIETRMHDLAQSCKECKAVLISLDREPSSENTQLHEFRELMRKRNQIENFIDSYNLQLEALRDVKAYHNGQEAVLHPHRFTGGRPLEFSK